MYRSDRYDLLIIGAGSGGLSAAHFATRLGAKIALVEKQRIGGDCTWTGCVPSKALLKAAKVAHAARTAAEYGIRVSSPVTDMAQVRAYVRQAVAEVYQYEMPEQLEQAGIPVILGSARFLDPHTIQAGDRLLTGKQILLTTGAHPVIPPIPGLRDVPYLTYEQIFENSTLPQRLLIIGAGATGVEIAQAYQRFGSQVTLIDSRLLPMAEPEAAEGVARVLTREGIQWIPGQVVSIRQEGVELVVTVRDQDIRGDCLLLATGRAPNVDGLDLEKAGVAYTSKGIQVDAYLRTSARHIYAAGDCLGGDQFTHLAGWQAFQAVRNALLPGRARGHPAVRPWAVFTDPEVAQVGLTERAAREKLGEQVVVTRWDMAHTDRAVCENQSHGFIKVVHRKDGRLLGATVVTERAGEVITEFVLGLEHGYKIDDLARPIHVYPTYATPVQQMAAEVAVTRFLNSAIGRILQRLARR